MSSLADHCPSLPARRRRIIALLVALGVLYPLVQFKLSGNSVFLTFWEFACYRYYGGLSNLAGDLQNLWVVQGFPMALLQNAVLSLLQTGSPDSLGSVAQIDLFAWITLALAYGITAAILAWSWLRSNGELLDLATVSLMTLAMWPLTRYYPYLFAPDYWISEVPFYLVSCLWTLSRLHARSLPGSGAPPWLFFPLVGGWMGLAFLQKPSLVAFAALPAVVELLQTDRRWLRRGSAAAVVLLFAAGSHWFFFQAYYRFQFAFGQAAYLHYWNWLIHHPETGTSLLTFPQLWQAANFLFVPIGLGLVGLAVVTGLALHWTGRPVGIRMLPLYLWAGAAGHLAVIMKRPSGTSVVDAMFYGTFILPVLFGLLPDATKRPAFRILGTAVLVASLVYRPVLLGSPPNPGAAGTLAMIESVRTTVEKIGRPVILLLPDNRIHPHTAEAFGLYTGHLNLSANTYDARGLPVRFPPDTLRGRLLPNAFQLGNNEQEKLAAALAAGYVIMWGEATNAPAITDFFPIIGGLGSDPAVTHLVFAILPGDALKTHLAYRKHAAPGGSP